MGFQSATIPEFHSVTVFGTLSSTELVALVLIAPILLGVYLILKAL